MQTCNSLAAKSIHSYVSPIDVAAVEALAAPTAIAHPKALHKRRQEHAPIIIMGMHRSGTSLLSRMLESLGLFLGKSKDENNEAVFFQSINDWLLRQTGGAWDNPAPFRYLLDSPDISQRTTDYIRRYLLTSPRAASYVGWFDYLRHRRLAPLARAWGWKDPRNTFTLPIWLDIFPEAKIIHLHRAGMDVSQFATPRPAGVPVIAALSEPAPSALDPSQTRRLRSQPALRSS